MICIASRTGVIALLKPSLRPAMIPSGIPIASATETDATISASVCMLSVQSPMIPNATSAANTTSDARQPHQRTQMPTSSSGTPTHVKPFSRLVISVTSQLRKFEIGFRT